MPALPETPTPPYVPPRPSFFRCRCGALVLRVGGKGPALLATLYALAFVAWALLYVVWDWLGRPWRKG